MTASNGRDRSEKYGPGWFLVDLREGEVQRVTESAPDNPPRFVKIYADSADDAHQGAFRAGREKYLTYARGRAEQIRARRGRSRDPSQSALDKAWAADAHAKKTHTWEDWQVAADAFEAAGEPDIAERLRRETASLRTNWSRRELLHVAIVAAEEALAKGKRPTENLFRKAQNEAWEAIRRADRLAGSSHHKSVNNSAEISKIARRAVTLARKTRWPAGSPPTWRTRVGENPRRAQERADAREFSRRQNMSPYIQVRRMPGHNSYDVALTLGTTNVGSKSERLRNGKVVSVHYFLPPIGPIEEQLREYRSRPTARDRSRTSARTRRTPMDRRDRSPRRTRSRSRSVQLDEIQEMSALLSRAGFENPRMLARKLSREGIGTYELEGRLRHRHGTVGSLGYTHNARKKSRDPSEKSRSEPIENNPWVGRLGGTTTFGALHVGDQFRFPRSPQSEVLTKASRVSYVSDRGGRFRTGSGTAVVKLTARDSSSGQRRDSSSGNPKNLEVGDVVYDKHDPDTFGTIKKLEYDHRYGSEGMALVARKRSRRSASVITGEGVVASEFHARGSVIAIPTKQLVRLTRKNVKGRAQQERRDRDRDSSKYGVAPVKRAGRALRDSSTRSWEVWVKTHPGGRAIRYDIFRDKGQALRAAQRLRRFAKGTDGSITVRRGTAPTHLRSGTRGQRRHRRSLGRHEARRSSSRRAS